MESGGIIATLQESFFVLIIFAGFLTYAVIKGRQSLINLIMGLYFALLISLKFPYYDTILGGADSAKSKAFLMIFVFVIFTVVSTMLFSRLMPREYKEKALESFWRKLIYATAATVLVMSYSFHVIPITEFVSTGPIQSLFNAPSSFFFWLLTPIVVLFFV